MSEWERLWSKKITGFLFLSIPFILWLTSHYYQKANLKLSPTVPEYTVFANFPIMGLNEQLLSTFNLLTLVFVVMSITEEYHTGQLRMVMLRAYSYRKIFIAKVGVIIFTLILFLIWYFLSSYFIGYLMFPHTDVLLLFWHKNPATLNQTFVYNLAYYVLALFTIIPVLCVMTLIAVISPTTTTAIGGGVAFLILSFVYSDILGILYNVTGIVLLAKLQFTSLLFIQWQGISLMLAEQPVFVGWNFFILLVYTLFSGLLAFNIFSKRDQFI